MDTDAIKFNPGELGWLLDVYSFGPCEPAVQEVGEATIMQGRLITWPNVLQHQFQSVELLNPAQSGHLKLLTIFLVDPNIRVMSTANVPSQQRHWWVDAIRRGGSKLTKLPLEVQDLIFDQVDDAPLSLDEARRFRIEFMAERETFIQLQTDTFLRNYFNTNLRPQLSGKDRLGSIFPNFNCDHYI